MRRSGIWLCISVFFTLLWFSVSVYATSLDSVTPDQLVREARLIFEGTVTNVAYRKSDVDAPDQVGIPHTFVTFKIENIYKGSVNSGSKITLRFEGGPEGNDIVLLIPGIPLFNVGDRDILFVRGNGESMCPLVGCVQGRFRVIDGTIYTDDGHDLWLTSRGNFVAGRFHPLEQIMKKKIGDSVLTLDHSEPNTLWKPAPELEQLDAGMFRKFIEDKVKKLDALAETPGLQTERSVSILERFHAQDATPVSPPAY